MSWWSRRRLRARILLPFSLLLLAALLATLWVVGAAVTGWVETSLRRQFGMTGNVFRALMAERAQGLIEETSLLAADFALKRAIATYDPETLESVAVNQRERLGVELLWIADERGRLLAAAGGAAEVGHPVVEVAPVARVMESGRPAVAVTEVGGVLVQAVATPVFAPDPIGYLVAGSAIDDDTARQLGAATGTHISFVSSRRVLASSWAPDERAAAVPVGEAPLADDAPGSDRARATFLVRVGDARLLSIAIPIEAELPRPLYVLVQASYDAALGPLVHLPQRFALLGAAALAAALLVAGVIAAGIAAPLQQLARAMQRVLAGDLSQRVALRREDEVGFLGGAFNEMVAGLAERERIKDTFGRFVSRDVASAVLSGDAALGGERREVTILFQDVRGFTTIAEGLPAVVLVRLVNELFTEMAAAVESEGGIIRQFTGDGVMAMFGAPVSHPDDAPRAVRTALAMVARLPVLNERLRRDGLPELRIGIGIHTGEVVAGRLGPDERSEYGVVGDTVNIASRIEGLTRDLGATILVSAATASLLGPEFALGRRAVVPVKGKAQPVEVVEVIAARA
ncbi:MAG TPA: adenylate/guanylate cyclase domain-containing protein [Candidatus Binatia bacterium]|nr:adenylate/guanylate cyclase domain-containing protein [Candidatus Binatia bacterium]